MQETNVQAALVSTNSIVQGEQVVAIWKPLIERFAICINFAWQSFLWDSESKDKAHVYCVIIGFGIARIIPKKIFFGNIHIDCREINPYLLPAPVAFVESRTMPLCDIPQMMAGNRPADGGALIIEADEYADFITK